MAKNWLDEVPDPPYNTAFARWIDGYLKYPDTPRAMLMNCPTYLMVGANVVNELAPRRKRED
jgi:hypothetical protein